VEALLTSLADTALAEWVRLSRWGYAAINALHVLGIALLIGAIVALDLRLLGWRKRLPLHELGRLLQPVAIAGLLLAMVTGCCCFSPTPAAMPPCRCSCSSWR